MKQFSLILFFVFLFCSMDAQLKVLSDGSTQGNGSVGQLRLQTTPGYIDIGPLNNLWSHFSTDRSYYYFSKPVYLGNGILEAYKNTNFGLRTGTSGHNNPVRFTILYTNGNVGIGTVTPAYKLDVHGDIATWGTVRISSDSRLKSEIKDIEKNKVDMIYSLSAKTYMKALPPTAQSPEFSPLDSLGMPAEIPVTEQDTSTHIGFLAQDIQMLYPELVKADLNGYLSVDYIALIPILVEAMKVQNARIEELEKALGEKTTK
jgi:hypothetical protein